MTELRPYLVTAPLTINCADNLDTSTIYVFDYNNSFVGEDNKPDKMITYLESFGGMFDILITDDTSYEEKEQLILRYFNAGSFFNIYTLTQTMIQIMFYCKGIEYVGLRSILSESEVIKFVGRNKSFTDKLVCFYNSLFLVMLLYSSNPIKDMSTIKGKYSEDRFNNEELSPNLCSLLLDEQFYTYYEKHVGKDLYYYTFLFDNRLYKSMEFIDVLTNKSNTLLPILVDMNNKQFQDFIRENKKES